MLGTVIGMALAGIDLARAQSPADYGCDRPIRLAFYEFGPLYHDGVGIDRDVVDQLMARSGCRIQTGVEPRAQIWQELEAGTLDMTTSGIRTEARRQFAYFIPYLGLKNVVVARRDIAEAIDSFDDVVAHPEWRIGVVRAYLHGPYFDNRLKTAVNVATYPDQNADYQALISGAVQVIVSPAFNYEFYLPTPELRQAFAMADVSPAAPTAQNMVFNRRRFTEAQIAAWTRLFEAMALDGTIRRICMRHASAAMAQALMTY